MTTTDTTTGQLILDTEQAEQHAHWIEVIKGIDPSEQIPFTLTFDVEPQPELRLGGAWRWLGKTYLLFTSLEPAILRSWWRGPTSEGGMGNTGTPRAGQRVMLKTPSITQGTTLDPNHTPLATATLAAVPRVEQIAVAEDYYDDMPVVRERFIVRAEVTPFVRSRRS